MELVWVNPCKASGSVVILAPWLCFVILNEECFAELAPAAPKMDLPLGLVAVVVIYLSIRNQRALARVT